MHSKLECPDLTPPYNMEKSLQAPGTNSNIYGISSCQLTRVAQSHACYCSNLYIGGVSF